jgi:hypothetical protein
MGFVYNLKGIKCLIFFFINVGGVICGDWRDF